MTCNVTSTTVASNETSASTFRANKSVDEGNGFLRYVGNKPTPPHGVITYETTM
jgi:hypothetical protein